MRSRDSLETYRFIDFELDVGGYALRRKGRPVRLEPRPMDLLILLVTRHSQLITHDDIVEALWDRDVFVETDSGIHTAIRKIRRVLRDSAERSMFVETVPGRGYRFIAPVEIVSGSPTSVLATPAGPSTDEPLSIRSAGGDDDDNRAHASEGTVATAGGRSELTAGLELAPGHASGRYWMAAAIVAIALLTQRSAVISRPAITAVPIRLLTVTSFPGSEGGPPALSPDGNFVAYTWSGPDTLADTDLWVKSVDDDAARQLTDTPQGTEVYPAWSPDGQQIAFVRFVGDTSQGIFVISPLGGPERKLVDSGMRPSWLPDSRSLIFHDRLKGRLVIVHHDLATSTRRVLTEPPPGYSDTGPRVSPDGKSVAFVRSISEGTALGGTSQAAVFVVRVAGGDAVQLHDWARSVGGPDWTPDSREILFPRWAPSGVSAFRVAAKGGQAVPAIDLPDGAYSISTSGFRSGRTFRVAAVSAQSDIGLRLVDLRATTPDGRFSTWSAFSDSSRIDWPGHFSHDGSRVAFTSDRSGSWQVYVAKSDGSRVRKVTALDGTSVGMPTWSPDDRFLVVDAIDARNRTDLHVVATEGGPLRPSPMTACRRPTRNGHATGSGSITRPTRASGPRSGRCPLVVDVLSKSQQRAAWSRGNPSTGVACTFSSPWITHLRLRRSSASHATVGRHIRSWKEFGAVRGTSSIRASSF
jgi:Tol biopolymer transport system component/DNA-binding winged helix-turn-helix (wHTH) protein